MIKANQYCPLMLIGFAPPKTSKEKDMRTCHPECRWYNEILEECNINIIAENVMPVDEYYDDIENL